MLGKALSLIVYRFKIPQIVLDNFAGFLEHGRERF
jgi:hypothetical protein